MNKDQLKGRAHAMGGAIKAMAGQLIGNKELEMKGNAQRSVGRNAERHGDIMQAATDASEPND